MSALNYYSKRFGVTNDVDNAVMAIEIAHVDIMSLLDIIIEIGEATHFDQDHLYAACRSAMARLVEIEPTLKAVSDFISAAMFAARDAQNVSGLDVDQRNGITPRTSGGISPRHAGSDEGRLGGAAIVDRGTSA